MAGPHDRHIARAVGAWLCRCSTEATLSELAGRLGLSRADSVPNLLRQSTEMVKELEVIECVLSTRTEVPSLRMPDGRIIPSNLV
jgi:hypothetical protein